MSDESTAVAMAVEVLMHCGCLDIETETVTVGYHCVLAGLPGGGDVSVYVDSNGAEVVTSVPARGGWKRSVLATTHDEVARYVSAAVSVAVKLRGAK